MPEGKSSLDLYAAFARELSFRHCQLERSDVEQLLESMRCELIVSNSSPLLDAAYASCRRFLFNHHLPVYKYEPVYFFFSDGARRAEVSSFDAWWLILLLAEDMSGVSPAENIDQLLPYLFGSYMLKRPDAGELIRALQTIDTAIRSQRKAMYRLAASGNAVHPRAAEAPDNAPAPKASPDAEKAKEEVLAAARKQGDAERERIIAAAREEAERILQRAGAEAEAKLAAARKRSAETAQGERREAAEAERQLLQKGFSDVREALIEANERIKRLEDTVTEASAKKASAQLLELFNLIADAKASALDLARKNSDRDLENAGYNMDVFLDMICEYMEAYGIRPIASVPGDRFSPKLHAPSGNQSFDPRSAVVKASRRTGFLWGEQVLQKEQVEI